MKANLPFKPKGRGPSLFFRLASTSLSKGDDLADLAREGAWDPNEFHPNQGSLLQQFLSTPPSSVSTTPPSPIPSGSWPLSPDGLWENPPKSNCGAGWAGIAIAHGADPWDKRVKWDLRHPFHMAISRRALPLVAQMLSHPSCPLPSAWPAILEAHPRKDSFLIDLISRQGAAIACLLLASGCPPLPQDHLVAAYIKTRNPDDVRQLMHQQPLPAALTGEVIMAWASAAIARDDLSSLLHILISSPAHRDEATKAYPKAMCGNTRSASLQVLSEVLSHPRLPDPVDLLRVARRTISAREDATRMMLATEAGCTWPQGLTPLTEIYLAASHARAAELAQSARERLEKAFSLEGRDWSEGVHALVEKMLSSGPDKMQVLSAASLLSICIKEAPAPNTRTLELIVSVARACENSHANPFPLKENGLWTAQHETSLLEEWLSRARSAMKEGHAPSPGSVALVFSMVMSTSGFPSKKQPPLPGVPVAPVEFCRKLRDPLKKFLWEAVAAGATLPMEWKDHPALESFAASRSANSASKARLRALYLHSFTPQPVVQGSRPRL